MKKAISLFLALSVLCFATSAMAATNSINTVDQDLSQDITDLNTSLTGSINQVNTNLSENIQALSDSMGEHLNGLKFSVTGEGKIHVELDSDEDEE